MARKKREIQKRKRLQEPGAESRDRTVDLAVPEEKPTPGSDRVAGRRGSAGRGEARSDAPSRNEPPVVRSRGPGDESVFSRGRENLLLGLLVLYVLLLGLGTIGELFEIEWILNLPLFR